MAVVAVMCISAVVAGLVLLFWQIPKPMAAAWGEIGSYDQSWYDKYMGGDYESAGLNEASPIKINNGAELAALAAITNNSQGRDFSGKYLKLDSDIDLAGKTWVSISNTKAFKGCFDGNNKRIYNMLCLSSYGLFRNIADGAIIKNFSIVSAIANGVSSFGGVFYSSQSGTLNAEVINCSFYGDIEYSGSYGSMFGGIAADGGDVKIKNCAFGGNLKITSSGGNTTRLLMGGITGKNGLIEDCVNVGTINVNSSPTSEGKVIVGGISGENYKTIKGCVNIGGITSRISGGERAGCVMAGGIAGVGKDVADSRNFGNVSGFVSSSTIYSGKASVGGVIGATVVLDETSWNDSGEDPYATINRCMNFGEISGESQTWYNMETATAPCFVGGMVGYVTGTNSFHNNVNMGDVTGLAIDKRNISYRATKLDGAGGILGGMVGEGNTKIVNSLNCGKISGSHSRREANNSIFGNGGIVGCLSDTTTNTYLTIKNSASLASQIEKGFYGTGLLGNYLNSALSATIVFDNCYSLASDVDYGLFYTSSANAAKGITATNCFYRSFTSAPDSSVAWSFAPQTMSSVFVLDGYLNPVHQVAAPMGSGNLMARLNARVMNVGGDYIQWESREADGVPVFGFYNDAVRNGLFERPEIDIPDVPSLAGIELLAEFTCEVPAGDIENNGEQVIFNTNTSRMIISYITLISNGETIRVIPSDAEADFTSLQDLCSYKIWYLDSNRQEVAVQIKELKKTIALVAQTVFCSGKVHLNYVGGINGPDSTYAELITDWYFALEFTKTLELPTVDYMNTLAVKAGHSKVFVGWYEDAECSVEIVPDATGKIMIPVSWAGHNKDVYAKWVL